MVYYIYYKSRQKSSNISGVKKCAGSTSATTVTKSDVTSTKTYTVTDKVGNEGSCKLTVSSQRQKKSCSSYASCNAAACGNKTCTNAGCCGYKTTYIYATAGGSSNYCPGGYEYIGPSGASNNCRRATSTAATCTSSCCGYKYCATSACGCYSWGSWTTVSSCSAGTFTQCRTRYY